MALILENVPLGAEAFMLRVQGAPQGAPGQFFMLRPNGTTDPFLPRPISIYDADAATTCFCIAPIGRGTELLQALRPGACIELSGPHGNGFPLCEGEAVLIGGGLGAAPLYYLAKTLAKTARVRAYLGFRSPSPLTGEFERVCETHTNIAGFVTEDVDFTQNAVYYACGPHPMLRTAAEKARAAGSKLYVSMEKRMACGVGACLCCTCKTAGGNRRVCKDGPVFEAEEVFFDEKRA